MHIGQPIFGTLAIRAIGSPLEHSFIEPFEAEHIKLDILSMVKVELDILSMAKVVRFYYSEGVVVGQPGCLRKVLAVGFGSFVIKDVSGV